MSIESTDISNIVLETVIEEPVEPVEPVESVVEPVEPVVEPVESVVEPVVEPVESVVEPVVEPVEQVIELLDVPIEPDFEPVVEMTNLLTKLNINKSKKMIYTTITKIKNKVKNYRPIPLLHKN